MTMASVLSSDNRLRSLEAPSSWSMVIELESAKQDPQARRAPFET